VSLAESREIGYLRYWRREFRPHLEGAVRVLHPAGFDDRAASQPPP